MNRQRCLTWECQTKRQNATSSNYSSSPTSSTSLTFSWRNLSQRTRMRCLPEQRRTLRRPSPLRLLDYSFTSLATGSREILPHPFTKVEMLTVVSLAYFPATKYNSSLAISTSIRIKIRVHSSHFLEVWTSLEGRPSARMPLKETHSVFPFLTLSSQVNPSPLNRATPTRGSSKISCCKIGSHRMRIPITRSKTR